MSEMSSFVDETSIQYSFDELDAQLDALDDTLCQAQSLLDTDSDEPVNSINRAPLTCDASRWSLICNSIRSIFTLR